jgi:hypothetical protein
MTEAEHTLAARAIARIAATPAAPRWAWALGAIALVGVAATLFVATGRGPTAPSPARAARVASRGVRPDAGASAVAGAAPSSLVDVLARPGGPLASSPPRVAGSAAPGRLRASAGARVVRPGGTAAGLADPLALESALLRRAVAALASDPREALAVLARYDARFPRGQLVEPRAWLEVAALERLGRGAEARARAASALRRFPAGMYTRQLQRVLDGAGGALRAPGAARGPNRSRRGARRASARPVGRGATAPLSTARALALAGPHRPHLAP